MVDDLVPSPELVEEVHIGSGDFVKIGDGMVERMRTTTLMIKPDSVVIDIGCGLGRLARPMTKFLGTNGRYYGFDINRRSIDWVRERYARFPNFHFDWIDLHSIFYNKDGHTKAKDFTFPLRENYADAAILTSVFTHMYFDDVANYLREVARMLKPGGRCLITYFLVDDSLRPGHEYGADHGGMYRIENGYVKDPKEPEAVVFLHEKPVLDLYRSMGLEIEHKLYGVWSGHNAPKRATFGGLQDEILARKRGK